MIAFVSPAARNWFFPVSDSKREDRDVEDKQRLCLAFIRIFILTRTIYLYVANTVTNIDILISIGCVRKHTRYTYSIIILKI